MLKHWRNQQIWEECVVIWHRENYITWSLQPRELASFSVRWISSLLFLQSNYIIPCLINKNVPYLAPIFWNTFLSVDRYSDILLGLRLLLFLPKAWGYISIIIVAFWNFSSTTWQYPIWQYTVRKNSYSPTPDAMATTPLAYYNHLTPGKPAMQKGDNKI